nr:molybdate ABC transporter substrate-binding protein [Rhabdothermincola salaria]
MTPSRAVLVVVVAGLVVAGCGSGGSGASDPSLSDAAGTAPALTGTVTVSAAASLTDAFEAIGGDFEAANLDVTVDLNLGSSGTLATQIEEGAPVDVAAFADEATMARLVDGGLVAGTSEVFATNQMIVVTKPGNPRNVTALADLADAGTISLCVDTAPCGAFADQILETAGVVIPESDVTRGRDVKATLGAVTEGDADAAIVYVTDAEVSGDAVDVVAIPPEHDVIARYPVAVVEGAADEALARAFVAYVLGPEARAVLEEAGFRAP